MTSGSRCPLEEDVRASASVWHEEAAQTAWEQRQPPPPHQKRQQKVQRQWKMKRGKRHPQQLAQPQRMRSSRLAPVLQPALVGHPTLHFRETA
jgi:hypothetical protein